MRHGNPPQEKRIRSHRQISTATNRTMNKPNEGDETQAALARYQEDRDLSVTGTVTAATLQALGLKPTAS
ncbi:MAG: hypothetical protein DME54_15090 [Verrucomicrobia bacterium]|nr:MAG: hypothetical protein DMF09_02410 [Verrucomicrobiota bacterium]PYJ92039.1 MAG: hypothetical protein DME62_14320 [Verrucomicrobiota bacterium]PYK32748.1 MAG: hypothetical protein DME54_15090 [Verrucomicrobiota bacterium]PYL82459.1 MAG: hypothetical protein DMF21_02325 [Verrucomicrobiota bacterium]